MGGNRTQRKKKREKQRETGRQDGTSSTKEQLKDVTGIAEGKRGRGRGGETRDKKQDELTV